MGAFDKFVNRVLDIREKRPATDVPDIVDEPVPSGSDEIASEETPVADAGSQSEPTEPGEAEEPSDAPSDPYGDSVGIQVGNDGEATAVYDMDARSGMAAKHVDEAGGSPDDVSKEPEAVVAFREDSGIEPIGLDFPFEAAGAIGEMLGKWHLRLVYDHGMPAGDDEPIVELYDGETGEFVSDYWVSTFCDDSEENEGRGLACKGAVIRFRIAYDDLVAMQGRIRPFPVVDEWYTAHEGDMPDHSV